MSIKMPAEDKKNPWLSKTNHVFIFVIPHADTQSSCWCNDSLILTLYSFDFGNGPVIT